MRQLREKLSSLKHNLFAGFHRLTGNWRPYIEPRIPAEEIATAMTAASIPSLSYFFLLTLASAIATFGLLSNSAPAIIGAMIIAPLMTPIMGLSYGLVHLSWHQIARSLLSLATGVALVILIGYFSTRFIDIKVTGSELISRAFPSLLDLGVAMAAGAAGAFSYSRDSIRNSVAGVAIAVALVPPLAVVGIGLALGISATADIGLSLREVGLHRGGEDIATGAFILFLTNLAGIVIVAGIVMVIQGYGRWKKAILGVVAVSVASLLLFQPLSDEFHKLRVKSQVLTRFKMLTVSHPHLFKAGPGIDKLSLRYQNDILHVHAWARVQNNVVQTGGAQERLDLLRHFLEEEVGEPLVLVLDAIPVELIKVRSAPDNSKPDGTDPLKNDSSN
jgi:uncharacterized hydrophobic protein (TIGR00271 family)